MYIQLLLPMKILSLVLIMLKVNREPTVIFHPFIYNLDSDSDSYYSYLEILCCFYLTVGHCGLGKCSFKRKIKKIAERKSSKRQVNVHCSNADLCLKQRNYDKSLICSKGNNCIDFTDLS